MKELKGVMVKFGISRNGVLMSKESYGKHIPDNHPMPVILNYNDKIIGTITYHYKETCIEYTLLLEDEIMDAALATSWKIVMTAGQPVIVIPARTKP